VKPIPLTHLWNYTDVDRGFWAAHLEAWVPPRIFDTHVHVTDAACLRRPLTDERRRQHWVMEVSGPLSGNALAQCDATTYPGRKVSHLAFGWPDLGYDLEAGNEYAGRECLQHGWRALALLDPHWPAERVAQELDAPGVVGVKPYYALIGEDPAGRDRYIEASIFDFLPHAALEVLNERGAWVTLHPPKADRLPHPDNIREIREIRRRYPKVILVIPHLGRCYTEPHAREGLPQLADDDGLYWDVSAALNPAVLTMALELFGPKRILYGTDNPVFYMRGRREWRGRQYVNHTSGDFHFNKGRHEPAGVEAAYTLFMYEALHALKTACDACGVDEAGVADIFFNNADRLVQRASASSLHP